MDEQLRPTRSKTGEEAFGKAARRVRLPALMVVVVFGPAGPTGTMFPPSRYTGGLSERFACSQQEVLQQIVPEATVLPKCH